jgi:hypothetical protein
MRNRMAWVNNGSDKRWTPWADALTDIARCG